MVSNRGDLRLALVADTHAQPHPAAQRWLRTWQPTAILHAGDIGARAVTDQLCELAPVFAVRGNIDPHTSDWPDQFVVDVREGNTLLLRILIVHIGVVGPRLRAEVAQLARARQAGLVVCGHSHVPFIGRERELTIFNPGSMGPRRFHLPIVFGTLTVTPQGIGLAHINCENEKPWLPDPWRI